MPPRILIIDDSALILASTRAALEGAGYEVATAETVEAFERERRRLQPDLILVDVQMPEAFGDDVVMTLREVYGERARVLLLSSLSPEELAERAARSGADGWITKGSGLTALVAKIRTLLPT